MRFIVNHSIVRYYHSAVVIQRFAAVWVHIEAREIAARDVHTDTVPLLENVGCRIELNSKFVYSARLHQFFLFNRIMEARSYNTVPDIQIEAARIVGVWRVNID